jgi:Coenzyme Q (ubiquinone) biosynthesis protein Coq4
MKKLLISSRSAILVLLTHKIALPLLKMVRRPNVFTYSKEQLMLLPEGSLGKDLFLFLEKRNLPLLTHYARHDLKHVLLNYDTTDEGEACLQTFMLGNGRVSFPVLATVLYGFITMPEHWKKMLLAYKQGKGCNPFHRWKWNELLVEQTGDLRNKIFNHS